LKKSWQDIKSKFREYLDEDGCIHTVKLGGTNNGNLYHSWASVLSLPSLSAEGRNECSFDWQRIIKRRRLEPGIFCRSQGSGIQNAHDDYRGIVFASFFLDDGLIAKEVWQNSFKRMGFFFEAKTNAHLDPLEKGTEFFKSWLWRHVDFVILMRSCAGIKPGIFSQLWLLGMAYIDSFKKSGQDHHFWAMQHRMVLNHLYDYNLPFLLFEFFAITRMNQLVQYGTIFSQAPVWLDYTQDPGFPLSQKEFYAVTPINSGLFSQK